MLGGCAHFGKKLRGREGKGREFLLGLKLPLGLPRKREVNPWLPESPRLLLNLHFLSGVMSI